MCRTIGAFALVLLLCGAALAAGRSLEDNFLISPVIVNGKVIKAAGDWKDGNTAYKKFEVQVTAVVRTSSKGARKDATITVYNNAGLKPGDELVMFLSSPSKHGYHLNLSVKKGATATLKRMLHLLALEAKAEKELDGKDKLTAALLLAHRLRPVLLAAAENKELKTVAAIPDEQRDKLLSVLAWGLKESRKKGAKAELRNRAELLRRVLSGKGGLPEYKTRNERIAQFLAAHLAEEQNRNKYKLAKLSLVDKAPAAAKPKPPVNRAVAVRAVIGRQVFVARQGITRPRPTTTKPTPKKPSLVVPAETTMGQAVNGLALQLRAENEFYNLKENPDQPVKITATFRNAGKKPIRFNSYLVFPMLTQILIVDPRGRLSSYADESRLNGGQIPAMGAWSFKVLKPGDAIHFSTAIPAARFRTDGDYQLCLVYKNRYGKRFGIRDAWDGELVSGRVKVKILRHGEKEPQPQPTDKPEPPKPTAAKPPPRHVLPVQPVQQHIRIEVQAVNGVIQKRVIIDGKEVKPEQGK